MELVGEMLFHVCCLPTVTGVNEPQRNLSVAGTSSVLAEKLQNDFSGAPFLMLVNIYIVQADN